MTANLGEAKVEKRLLETEEVTCGGCGKDWEMNVNVCFIYCVCGWKLKDCG